MTQARSREIVVVLNDVRSVHNVGSILRTADAFGVQTVYCVGYTPGVHDRFGRERADIAKTALGAEKTVEVVHVDTFAAIATTLTGDGYHLIALEQDSRSVPLSKAQFGKRIALIAGNEVSGISPDALTLCDEVVEIPMYGEKESLNVSVAVGIALYEMVRQ